MVPCGHLCLCEACSRLVVASRDSCPKCNQAGDVRYAVTYYDAWEGYRAVQDRSRTTSSRCDGCGYTWSKDD